MYGVLEKQVGELKEENKELKETMKEMQKQIDSIQNKEKSEFREMLYKLKGYDGKFSEFRESISGLLDWKLGIDKIIEKIKKILPI